MVLSPVSATSKLRPDLQWSHYGAVENGDWIAADPIAKEYYRFSELERAILHMFDGTTTIDMILNSKQGANINREWLNSLVSRANLARLLVSHQPSNLGKLLWMQSIHITKKSRFQWLLNPLSFRVRLFDPTVLLDALAPLARLLFCRPMRWLVGLSIPLVSFLVFARLLHSGNGNSAHFAFSFQQTLVLLLVYLIIKSLHELGHALACKFWQAECHEIGLMFLVFSPCLYCDTSDSWRISDHHKRAWIAAAGIYVELLIALFAAVIWLITLPIGTIHWLAMYAMMVGSVSTVVVNANPLLRYDGYYVLSDLLRIPNLAEQGQEAFQAAVVSLITGLPVERNRWDGSLRFLLSYDLLAKAYRLVLYFLIMSVVWMLLSKLGLRLVAIGVIALATWTMLMSMIRNIQGIAKEIRALRHIRLLRVFLTLGLLACLLGLFLTVAWPTYAHARAITKISDSIPVYAKHSGNLTDFCEPGTMLEQNGVIASLTSTSLQFQWIELEGHLLQAQERLAQLRMSQVTDRSATADLNVAAEQLTTLQSQKSILEEELASLSIRTPVRGKFIWAETQAAPTLTEPTDLGRWSPLLEGANLGCLIEKGTLLGWIVPENKLYLTAIVSEQDARIIDPGAKVFCKWDCDLSKSYTGIVTHVSTEPIDTFPQLLEGEAYYLSSDGLNPAEARQQRHYEITISLENWPIGVVYQSLSTAHISTGHRTFWEILERYFTLNLRPLIENQ